MYRNLFLFCSSWKCIVIYEIVCLCFTNHSFAIPDNLTDGQNEHKSSELQGESKEDLSESVDDVLK
jgi:hypothetical protein